MLSDARINDSLYYFDSNPLQNLFPLQPARRHQLETAQTARNPLRLMVSRAAIIIYSGHPWDSLKCPD